MKTANSKAVYKKLMKTYGDSFQNMLNHHSLKNFDEQVFINTAAVKQMEDVDFFYSQESFMIEEGMPLTESFLKDLDSKKEKENIIFFSEGYVEAESYPMSSQEIHKAIEVIAQKVTRNIIDSKSVHKSS
ncbi:MAG: hypothetical protein ACM3KR_09660 [Deltaproteobacteria bacterium]